MSLIKMRRNGPELIDVRDDPFAALLRRFDSFYQRSPMTLDLGWGVPLEMTESPDEFVVTAELPGVAPQDIDLEVQENVLTLTARKDERQDREEAKMHVSERSYGEVSRSIMLPMAVDATQIRAELKEGVLTVHLPKREEVRTQRIEVKAG